MKTCSARVITIRSSVTEVILLGPESSGLTLLLSSLMGALVDNADAAWQRLWGDRTIHGFLPVRLSVRGGFPNLVILFSVQWTVPPMVAFLSYETATEM